METDVNLIPRDDGTVIAISPAEAVECLKCSFVKDPDYAFTWHANISCAAQDEGMDRDGANRAATRFMQAAFETDVNSKFLQSDSADYADSEDEAEDSKAPTRMPTVGDIVHYLPLDKRYVQTLPMITTHVNSDGTISGVFFDGAAFNGSTSIGRILRANVQSNLARGCWHWAPIAGIK